MRARPAGTAERAARAGGPHAAGNPAFPVAAGPSPPRLAGDVVASWLAGRVVVAAALALAHFVSGQARIPSTGLLGWDAAYYRDVAERGYAGVGREALRFFPLVPLLTRGLGVGTHAGVVLLVLVNAAALLYAAVLVRLAWVEGLGGPAAARAVWLLALAPPAFVLVMGYSEAVWGVLAAGVFLGLRTRRWELAACAGLLAGLCRPVGVLLAAPAAVEAARGIRGASAGQRLRRVPAVLAAPAGVAAYLLWVGAVHGDPWLPLRLQRAAAAHGATTDPLRVVLDAARGTLHGRLGTGLHVPWLLVCVVLVVVMARRLPASYTVWSALTLAAVLSGSNLDSLERYAFGAFPFVLVAAVLLRRRTSWWLALVASTALLAGYATLAFLLFYVP
ncbi:MAG TPA: hypothetical protein VKP11_06290 [Frankiaceae bacterium]|nr:hypothetical protein [Frankiaceae bacterium]